jgi:hypothetical protein
MTQSTSDTQHNNALPYAECRYAECRILFAIMLSVILLSVVAPFYGPKGNKCKSFEKGLIVRRVVKIFVSKSK